MKTKTSRLLLAAAAVVLGTAAVLSAGSADAGSRYKDRIYADSFGNLIVYSRSGYKRIVIGAGHLAEELAAYEGGNRPDEPDVVYLDEGDYIARNRHYGRHCKPVLLKGRSYMYGLPDGYLPAPGCDGLR
ncbi:MAG TPA: hypothetical protein VMF90_19830 [Rhizobiaceae bacterium]|nr:hypothetical protein [Rhizobiaceae bacterium]